MSRGVSGFIFHTGTVIPAPGAEKVADAVFPGSGARGSATGVPAAEVGGLMGAAGPSGGGADGTL